MNNKLLSLKYIKENDIVNSFNYYKRSIFLSQKEIEDCQYLLKVTGIPYIVLPYETDKLSFYFKDHKIIDYIYSEDSDFLLYNTNNLLTDNPKLNYFSYYNIESVLKSLDMDKDTLIELSIIFGSDYNKGLKGHGVIKGFELISKYKNIQNIIQHQDLKKYTNEWLTINEISEIKNEFTNLNGNFSPENGIYIKEYLKLKKVEDTKLYNFLAIEKRFSKKRVDNIIKRFNNINMDDLNNEDKVNNN